MLQCDQTGRRHADDALQTNPGIAPVGGVFDLRQQVKFVGTRRANHGPGLGTLLRSRKEVP
jgi:hypothetical protein